MENNDDLKRIKLFMNYDSKKTLSENEQRLKPILLEYKKGSKSLGNWCADSDYNIGAQLISPKLPLGARPAFDQTIKKGTCFKPKTDAGPNAWAYYSNDPFEHDDPLVFDCGKKSGSHLWEPDGYGDFWSQGLDWKRGKTKYYNNQLEKALKAHFCTVPKEGFAGVKYWDALMKELKNYGLQVVETSGGAAASKITFLKDKGDIIAGYANKDGTYSWARANSPYAGEAIGDFLITGTGGKTLRTWLDTHVKKNKDEYGVDPKAVAAKVGGGGAGTIGSKNTNMKDDDITYWKALFDVLESAGYDPITKGSAISTSSKFYVGNFTISRDSKPFVCLNCPSPTPSESQLLTSGYTFANIDPDRGGTPGKYSGESDLAKIPLLTFNSPGKERTNLIDFLALTATKPGVKDKTGGKTGGYTGGGGTGGKTGGDTGGKTGGKTGGWKSCSGTYSYGCKSPEVGEAQRCLGIYADNKFGGKTLNAIKRKLGKSSFTDNDLKNIICKKPGGGGGKSEYDFDKEDIGSETEVSQGPQSFTGKVY